MKELHLARLALNDVQLAAETAREIDDGMPDELDDIDHALAEAQRSIRHAIRAGLAGIRHFSDEEEASA